MSDLTTEQIKHIRRVHDDVMRVVSESELDANLIIAVLTKCLVEYAIHVEDRDDFHVRMAMTYDFEKSQQPNSKEVH